MTVADLRAMIADLPDDMPVEAWSTTQYRYVNAMLLRVPTLVVGPKVFIVGDDSDRRV